MAWVRIDDQVPHHQKFLEAGPAAAWFWVCGVAHCQRQLSDGFISEAALPLVGVPKGYRKLAEHLVYVGLFDRVEGGYQVHDYHQHNRTRDEAEAHTATVKEQRRLAGIASGERRRAARLRKQQQEQTTNGPVQHPFNEQPTPMLNPDPTRPDPTPPVPEERETVTPAQPTVLAGTLPRDHLRHGWCSSRGKCVPDFLHAEFCASVGGEGASQRLKAFYEAVEAGWPAGPIGDEPIKLWRAEFAAKFPRVAPTHQPASNSPGRTRMLTDATREFLS